MIGDNPYVTGVIASPGTADLGVGQSAALALDFDEPVVVTGTPTLTLNDGGTAAYVSGSGTSTLRFVYTVASGQTTPDLTVTGVNLGAAAIDDQYSNAADLSGAVVNPAGTLQIGAVDNPTQELLFTSGDGATLFQTDGSTSGSLFLADAASSPLYHSDPIYSAVSSTVVGSTVYFTMADATDTTSALWSYDGSYLTQITPSSNYVFNAADPNTTVNPQPLSSYNGDVVFGEATLASNTDAQHDTTTLAIYDPVAKTTVQPTTPNGGYDPHDFVTLNGVLYFEATDSTTSAQAIYSYNGTAVTEIYNLHPTFSNSVYSPPITEAAVGTVNGSLIAFNGHLYFGSGQESVEELNALTSLSNNATNVAGAAAYAYNGFAANDLIVSNNHLFFNTANNGVYSLSTSNVLTNLVSSDGAQSYDPVVFNNKLYFTAYDISDAQNALYSSTGASATLLNVGFSGSDFVAEGNTLYYDNNTDSTLGTISTSNAIGTLSVPGEAGGAPLEVVPLTPLTWLSHQPVVSSPVVSVDENSAAAAIGIAAPTDPDVAYTADQLVITVGALPTDGTVTLGDGTTAVTAGETLTDAQLTGLLFTPSSGAFDTSSTFSYTVADPADYVSTGIATLEIGPALGNPVTDPTAPLTAAQGASGVPIGIAAPTDPNYAAADLSIYVDSLPIDGTVTLADGVTPVTLNEQLTTAQLTGLKFTPTGQFARSSSFTYSVYDPTYNTSPGGVTLSVGPYPLEVTSIAASGSVAGSLDAGRIITLTVTPAAASTVTGSPTLLLSNGATASYVAGSSTPTSLVFTTTVASGQDTADLLVTGINFNGGSIGTTGSLGFSAASQIGLISGGTAPITTADLQSNGRADVILGASGNQVAVLLENASGGFAPRAYYAAGTGPDAIAAADLNFDGAPDIVVADSGGGVAILLNNNSGGFATAVTYAAGPSPDGVAVADLNGDTIPDLAVADQTGGVAVLLGNGDGGFAAPVTYAAGSGPSAVTIADLNGDGNPDLIVADSTGGTVAVLLGDGSGGFGAATTYAAGPSPNSVAAVDLNGDGRLDLVVADGTGGVAVLLADGSGGFDAATTYAAGLDPQSLTIADVNGDGIPDIVVADPSGGVAVLLGNGSGGFAAPVTYAAGTGGAVAVTTADVNADGKPDLILINSVNEAEELLNSSAPPGSLTSATLASATGHDTGLVLDTIAPTATPLSFTATENAAAVALGIAAPTDPTHTEAQLTITAATLPNNGTVTLADGTTAVTLGEVLTSAQFAGLKFTPTSGLFNASSNFTYTVADPAGNVTTGTAAIAIGGPVGNPVLASSGPVSVAGDAVGTAVSLGIVAPTDPNYVPADLTITVGTLPLDGLVTLADGTTPVASGETLTGAQLAGLLFKPALGVFGASSVFTYTVADPGGNSSLGTVDLAIGPQPVAVTAISAVGSVPGALNTAKTVSFTLTLSEAAQLTGSPTLLLSNGASASYDAAASTGTSLAFSYTIASGQDTTDLQVSSLSLNGGTITIPRSLGFVPAVSYTVGLSLRALTTADLNGDGKPDIIAADNIGGAIVLLNNGSGGFDPATTFAAGNGVKSVVAADLNNDGHSDLVLADAAGGVAVLLGNGSGGFAAATTYAAGPDPYWATAADLNGDGHPDLIVADRTGGVAVLLGNGSGGFSAPTTYQAGTAPLSVTTADLNGDGHLDLIVADATGGTVAVLLGNGSGGFATATTYAAGPIPTSLALADLTGNGHLDLIAADNGGGVAVLMGDGSGGFGPATTYAVGGGGSHAPESITTADINGDGHLDLVVADLFGGAVVLLGDGSGGFGAPITYAAGSYPEAITTADINGDGKPDIVVAGTGGIDVLQNSSTEPGTFNTATVPTATGHDTGLVIATALPTVSSPAPASVLGNAAATGLGIAAPSDPDYALANLTITVATLPTDGMVTLADGTTLVTVGETLTSAQLTGLKFTPTAGLFDSSSAFTYTVADPATNSSTGTAILAIAPSVGNPVAGATSPVTFAENAAATALGIAAPTDPNYAAAQLTATVSTLPSNGTVTLADGVTAVTVGEVLTSAQLAGLKFIPTVGVFGQSSSFTYSVSDPSANTSTVAGSVALAIGPEVIAVTAITAVGSVPGTLTAGRSVTFTATLSNPVTVTGAPTLLLSNGATATYVAGSSTSTSLVFSYSVAAGQDTSDLLVSSLALNGGTIGVPGSVGFAAPVTYAAGLSPSSVTTVDLNGDGHLDLVVADADGGTVSVLLGNGSGGFGAATTYAAGPSPYAATAADLNGDGHLDLVAADYHGGVSVLLGNGSGGFGAATTYAAGANPASVTTADVNGDGHLDLVVADSNGGVAVLLGDGSGGFGAATTYAVGAAGANPASVTTADVNGDGHLDLVVADSNGGVAVLLGNGSGGFGAATTYAAGSGPYSVTTADLNGDGHPDLVVADSNGGVAVLLGNGSGGFGAAATYAAGVNPYSVTAADVNGDGHLDLVVADGGGGVSVLLGNGSGGFGTATTYAAGADPLFVTTADVNGDGHPDLLVADESGGVAVLLERSIAPASLNAATAATVTGANTGIAIDTIAPTATANAPLTVAENAAATPIGIAAPTDPSYSAAQLSATVGTLPTDGTVTLADGTTAVTAGEVLSIAQLTGLEFTPKAGLFGTSSSFTYSVTDPASNTASGSVALDIAATPLPVTAISFVASKPGALNAAASVSFTLSLPVSVRVTGSPTLLLSNGGIATYNAASSTATSLVFGYSVLAGQDSSDLLVNSLSFNGGSISAGGGGSASFAAPVTYAAGSGPDSVTTADVNGDGRPDLVVTDSSNSVVSVLLGNGSGGFGAPTTYSSGFFPYAVTAVDLNGDGHPDLVATNYFGGVSVLLGNGSGGFGAATSYGAGTYPRAIATADVNADGHPDLVVADFGGGVSVLLGNGSGGFSAVTSYAAGSNPLAVTTADLTGDGHSDIVVANAGSGISVLLNNGSGGFGAAISYAAGPSPYAVTTVDVNGDGHLDLIVADEAGGVSVLLGNGSGGFGAATTYAAGPAPYAVTTADVNGDGHPDLIVADEGGGVSVLLGNGSGGFGAAISYAAGSSPDSVTTADVNGDGHPDLIVAGGGGNSVSVLLSATTPPESLLPTSAAAISGNDTGLVVDTIAPTVSSPTLTVTASASATAIGIAAPTDPTHTASQLTITLGALPTDGTVTLAGGVTAVTAGEVLTSAQLTSLKFTPFSGLAGSVSTLTYTVADPAANVSTGTATLSISPEVVAVASISAAASVAGVLNAGRTVVFTATLTEAVTVTGAPTLHLSNGAVATYDAGASTSSSLVFDYTVATGQDTSDLLVSSLSLNGATIAVPASFGFAPAVTYAVGTSPNAVTAADLNNDGHPDLIVANGGGGVSVLLGNAGGGFGAATSFAAGTQPISVKAVDLNNDGHLDLVVADRSGGVDVLLGDGSGGFGAPTTYAAGTGPVSVATTDLNGDGHPDLVVGDANGAVSVLLGNGSGGFTPAVTYAAGSGLSSVAVADLNGDGKPDIIATTLSGAVSVLLGNGSGGFAAATTYAAGPFPVSVATADLTGDGRLDLVVADQGGGVAVLFGNGSGGFAAPVTYAAGLDPTAVTTADVNGDGHLDLVVSSYYGGVATLLGNGSGGFGAATLTAAGTGPVSVGTADVNSDGLPDLLAADQSGSVAVLRNISRLAAGSFDPTSVTQASGLNTNLVIDTFRPVASSPAPLTVAENAAATELGIAAPSDVNYTVAQLTITVGTLPTDGTVTLADGITAVTSGEVLSGAQLTGLKFTQTAGLFDTSSTFTYTVADPASNISTGAATLAIGPAVGDPSLGVASPVTAAENAQAATIGIAAPTDPNYSAGLLTITVGTLPTDGTVTLADGTTAVTAGEALSLAQLTGLKFTPTTGGFNAVSTFTYVVADPDANSSTGTRTLAIGPALGDPAVSVLDPVTVSEYAPATAIGIAAPTDPNYSAADLTITVATLPTDGAVTLADGTTPVTAGETLSLAQLTGLKFTPISGVFDTSSSFTYSVVDPASNASTGSVTLAIGPAVGNPALGVPPAPVTTVENAAATAIGFAAPTDPNYDSSQLTITVGTLPTDGTVTLADGTTAVVAGEVLTGAELTGLKFTPTAGAFSASSSFTYTVADPAANSSTGSATLAIGPAVGDPVAGSTAPFVASYNAATGTIGIAAPTDPNFGAGLLTATLGTLPDDGTVTLADGITAVTTGEVLSIGQLTGLEFTPTPGLFSTSSTLSYTLADPADNTSVGTTALTIGPQPASDLTVPPGINSGDLVDIITDGATNVIAGDGTAGDTIALFDGLVQVGSATVGIDGTWSTSPIALALGPHQLTAIQTDANGNAAAPSKALLLIIDAVPAPAAGLTLDPVSDSGTKLDDVTDITTPVITGTGVPGDTIALSDSLVPPFGIVVDPVGSATVGLDGTWSLVTSSLTAGLHSLIAVQSNPDGIPAANSAALALTIVPVPTAASGLTLAPGSDSGTALDGITDVATPVIQGLGVAGDTIALFDGLVQVGSATVASDGTWSAVTSSLAVGPHSLTAVQDDPYGNPAPTSAALALTIDPVPAAASGLTLAPASDSGIALDDITDITTPMIQGSGVAGDTISLFDGLVLVGTATVAPDGTWSAATSSLALGAHSLTAVQYDADGNAAPASTALTLTIDAVPSVPSGLTLAPASDSGSKGDDLTNVTTPTITGAGVIGDSVTLYNGATAIGTAIVGGDGTWSITPSVALADGLHGLTAKQTDTVGDISPASTMLALTIDTAIPPATSDLTLAAASDSGIQGDDVTNVTTPAITGTGIAGDVVTLFDGAAAIGAATVGGGGTWSITPSAALANGVHSLTATQTSPAGNVSPRSALLPLTIDTAVPPAPGDLALAGASDSGVAGDDITNISKPTITGTGIAGNSVTLFDGASIIGAGTVAGDGTWSITLASALADGVSNLTAIQTSAAGNVSAASDALALTIDTVAPAPTSIAQTDSSGLTGMAEIGSVVTFHNAGSVVGTAATNAGGSWNFLPSTLSAGTYALTATVADAAGNVSAASAAIALTVAADHSFSISSTEAGMTTVNNYDPDDILLAATTTQPNTAVATTQTFSLIGTLTSTTTTNAAGLVAQTVTPTSTVRNIYDSAGTLIGTVTEPGSATGSAPPNYLTAGVTDGANTATDAVPNVVHLLSENQTLSLSGDDTVIVGTGNDTISANTNAVSIAGGSGALTFYGGSGVSTVSGGSGSATIAGGSGGGQFTGGQTAGNLLVAGGGNTTLVGGSHADVMFGGVGQNTLVGSTGGADTIVAGSGSNAIDAAASDVVFAGAGQSTVYGGAAGGNTIVGGGNDVMAAGGGFNVLFGGAGHDTMYAGTGTNVLAGGAGTALMVGEAGSTDFVGGSGRSTVFGGAGNDTVWSGAGSMTANLGGGADTVILGSGSADIFGGAGRDIYDVIKGEAGGTDMISNFKVGTDQIAIYNYGENATQQTINGSTILHLTDGTTITLVGVTHLDSTSIV